MGDVEIENNLQNELYTDGNNFKLPDDDELKTDNFKSKDTSISEIKTSNSSKSVFKDEENNTSIGDVAEEKNTDVDDEWLDIMGSGNFKKLVLEKGLGFETRPERGERVTVNVKYFLGDVLLEEKENFQFIVGDMDVIQGLDLVIGLIEKDETARVKVPPKLAYGLVGRKPDIPPESNLELEVKLLDVQPIDLAALTIPERLELGESKRLRGNYFYERAEYLEAIYCYERAAEYLEGVRDSSGSSTEESQKLVDMIIKVYNNMAASHLKLNAHQAALKSVESVLNVQPKNVKALFRKAKILSVQGSTDEAINCLKLAASLEPDTKVIQSELARLRSQKKKEEETQKAMYKRMFPPSEPQPKTCTESYSKVMKIGAITAGFMAIFAGVAAYYKQFHS